MTGRDKLRALHEENERRNTVRGRRAAARRAREPLSLTNLPELRPRWKSPLIFLGGFIVGAAGNLVAWLVT